MIADSLRVVARGAILSCGVLGFVRGPGGGEVLVLLSIDQDSSIPPYEQICTQIIELVRQENLPAGCKLPTVRQLAAELGIAPNTVARSYRELEAAGVIETRGRQGSFVAAAGDPTRSRAQTAAVRYVTELRGWGFTDEEISGFVAAALRGLG
ncbi:DNA-binding transcriptional regulator YhcF (GntR family) [Hoyosella altamirensis]|uniref:DNA-binding transcriptional regulator YhcF (GntR family) n=1 Tax=Hoyosella altamirensis TaxID=616997 RepID=A0A839RIJ9_9ACTN|nr:DNA-binding transcriptional regulator YhcF (GntR family) [Hoyosella altamirensis]